MSPKFRFSFLALSVCFALTGCGSNDDSVVVTPPTPVPPTPVPAEKAKNVIFMLGDGYGMTTMTAARIYKVGEDGELTLDTLPETAFVKTFSQDAQVTDSAPSMAAYMTGVKMNNEVISMSSDTSARDAAGKDYVLSSGDTLCPTTNGKPVQTLLELFKSKGLPVGVVTTTRITHATPADTYAHICHRDGENAIAAQLVPNGAGYNKSLADGVDVFLGGGKSFFTPTTAGGKRTDGRDLIAELKAANYTVAGSTADLNAIDPSKLDSKTKIAGLFTKSHMTYNLDRDPALEPSLAEMTSKAIDVLNQKAKNQGFFLMVEGGRIDHALHETNARRALEEASMFDDSLKTAISKMKVIDPTLKNTLIVVTADHDHSIVLNGYAKRTGKTTESNPGVLGLAKSYINGNLLTDINTMPYSIIGFGNGENRPMTRTALTDATVFDKNYHQEAVIQTAAGSETHGGADVFLGAIGNGADQFHGVLENIDVYGLVRKATGL